MAFICLSNFSGSTGLFNTSFCKQTMCFSVNEKYMVLRLYLKNVEFA